MNNDDLNALLVETDSGPDQVLEKVERFVRRFVVMSDAQACVISLFVVHTFVIDAAESTPYIAVTSAEKRSGKTRLLEVLELLVHNPLRAAGATAAALFRALAEPTTVLFDEIDAVFSNKPKDGSEELRAVLNSGYRRGNPILRVVGDRSMKTEKFDVFGAKVLSGIGALPDTVADRSVPLRLARRAPGETVERFRFRDAQRQAAGIREALQRWAAVHLDALHEARPELPDELDDRAQDVVEPLLGIADLVGGEWPDRARRALVALKSETTTIDDVSLGIRLLADIRDVFDRAGTDKLSTQTLIAELEQDEEAPWGGRYDDGGPRRLARDLRPYGIRSKNVRLHDGTVPKGYAKESFTDAWCRYLPDITPLSATALQTASTQGLSRSGNDNGTPLVADTKQAANPHGHSDVAHVAAGSASPGVQDVLDVEA